MSASVKLAAGPRLWIRGRRKRARCLPGSAGFDGLAVLSSCALDGSAGLLGGFPPRGRTSEGRTLRVRLRGVGSRTVAGREPKRRTE